ncbi:MAG: (2Fe-2S)-binding protein [Actinomycetota bacterium]|nr:(2Fe-2S)-binding protein [Actinomycetota bacterium]
MSGRDALVDDGAVAAQVLRDVLARFGEDDRGPLVLGAGETHVAAVAIEDPAWLAEQVRLRGERWRTDDARVLATLWWYSASAWVIGPTLASLAVGAPVLSADLGDLSVRWLGDSRITGATSSRVIGRSADADPPTHDRVEAAAASLRRLYDRVIPAVAAHAAIAPRPLWAIATDAIANRLLVIGRAIGEEEATTALLDPLVDAVGHPMPRGRYVRDADADADTDTDGLRVRRCSCCLLYLAPGQSTCGTCPRLRAPASSG